MIALLTGENGVKIGLEKKYGATPRQRSAR